MKKIKMILTNRYDPDIRVHKEARYLKDQGFDVEILAWDREGEYKDKKIEEVDGIRVRRFYSYARYGTGLKQISAFYLFIRELKEYLKDEGYDYLHCHDLDGIIAGYFSNKKKGKLVFDMHEFYTLNSKNKRYKMVMKAIVNFFQGKSDNIIYLNDLQLKYMKDKNKQKLTYLPNYPEKANFIGSAKIESKDLNISYIGTVRQYEELKNLILAAEDMRDIYVRIHGAGLDYRRLKEIEDDYENLEVSGRYDYEDSISLYNQTDVLYMLYSTDNFQYRNSYPIKLYEAIITRTPVIVNKKTVLEDFIRKYDIGFAVDNDIEEIKNLIKKLAKDKNLLEEKRENLGKIQYKYSWENIITNLDEIYS